MVNLNRGIKMMSFKSFLIVFFIGFLMLSCHSDRRERGDRSDCNKEGTADCGRKGKAGKKGKRTGKNKGVRSEKIQVRSKAFRNENVSDEDLVVERPFDSDEEVEADDSAASEGPEKPVNEEAGAVGAAVPGEGSDESGEVKEVAEKDDEGGAESAALNEPGDVPVDVAAAMDEESIVDEEVFSITHAGEEDDEFLVRYQDQEIILDTPGTCVQLMGQNFNDLRVEDSTDLFPVICGTESICEPGNYNLINDSIPLIWDDYGMEPSEYNNSDDCQKLPLSE